MLLPICLRASSVLDPNSRAGWIQCVLQFFLCEVWYRYGRSLLHVNLPTVGRHCYHPVRLFAHIHLQRSKEQLPSWQYSDSSLFGFHCWIFLCTNYRLGRSNSTATNTRLYCVTLRRYEAHALLCHIHFASHVARALFDYVSNPSHKKK